MSVETRAIRLTVNGVIHQRDVEVRSLLSDFLRHELDLTGTRVGCEHGVCGACTVLVDGAAVRSCLMLAVQADGTEVLTVEAIATAAGLSVVQEAFRANHGLQCGFCTPGILMSLAAALRVGTSLEDVTADVLGGHLCRCTGYVNIRGAVREAWRALEKT